MCMWWWAAARGLRKEVQARPHPASASPRSVDPAVYKRWKLQAGAHRTVIVLGEVGREERDPSFLAPSTTPLPWCHGPTHGFQDEQKAQVPPEEQAPGEAARLEALQPRQSLG